MRQIAILVLVLLAAATASAATINCTSLPVPTNNFYNPPTACANDTSIAACITAYGTCVASTTSCRTGMSCVAATLRCFEKSAPTASACSTWSAMFSNEKLYLAAGGDYNGSTLELSCRNAICDYRKAHSSVNCTDGDYNTVCVDMVAGTPSPAPITQPPSTVPPAGATVVTFTINGDKVKFDILLNTTAGRKQVYDLVLVILMKILNVTDPSKIVIIDIHTGSLIINFYTTDPSLDVATVSSKIAAAKAGNQAALFGDLAAAAGIPVADLSVGDFTVSQATPTPQTPGGTPTPLTTSASAVATAFAVVAALLALLL